MYTKRIVAFVGPSGSGKDTLMVKSRDLLLSSGIDIHIVRRRITRDEDDTEQFKSISNKEFNKCVKNNDFSLHWEIYGNKYGIPRKEIDPYLEKKTPVLVNLSRNVLFKYKEIYPKGKIILVDISSKVAEERLKSKKRPDSRENIEARINRSKNKIVIPFPDLILKNESKINLNLSILNEFLRVLSL